MSQRYQDVLYAAEMSGCSKCRRDFGMLNVSKRYQDVRYVIEILGCINELSITNQTS